MIKSKQQAIAVSVAMLVLFGVLGSRATVSEHNGTSASAAGPAAGQVDPTWLSRSRGLLTSTDDVTRTVFLPALSTVWPVVPTVFGTQMYGELTEAQVSLTRAQDAGVYWVRWPLSWASVEPSNTLPANYHWDAYDPWILSATQADLHLVIHIMSNPDWAATYSNGPIDKVDISEYTQFVGALVERYDGDGYEDAPGSPVVDYWEIYNEPDAGDELRAQYGASYWGHFGAEYAQMLCATYPVVKAASPNAQVLLGGLAYDNFEDQGGGFVREFLDDVLEAGGGACFDVMNFHYYPVFAANWAPYGDELAGKANYLYDKLQEHGLGDKPMISTEVGWHSDFESTPEIQARYVVKLFTQSLASRLGLTIWWTWIDPGGYFGANGLLTQTLDPKLSYFAFQTASEKLGTATFEESWSSGDPDVVRYRFSSKDGLPLYVLWSNDDTVHIVTLPLSQAQLVNMYGQPIGVATDRVTPGQIQVNVVPDPTYVEAQP